ncbi:hypothetical protein MLD38_028433 [Melastoma candidum]|uniref:Uncharacterized protein n=1 Tax=Melastoma candidum TaxID=119954 RepID=A0ACB9N134_9MYRT|nr:hypothetical protein MLD38_028433 [Melastoma candidum]
MAAISIVSALSLLLLLLLHFSAARTSLPSPHSSYPLDPALQRQACSSTRFPDLCSSSSLSSPSPSPSPSDIVSAAIALSSDNLHKGQAMVRSILDSSSGNPNRTLAAKTCLEVLDNSDYRTGMAVEALPHGALKDARAWLSAALVYQYACWSGLKYVNDTAQVNDTMTFLNTLTMITSNALSMMMSYDVYGDDLSKWKTPMTERDGFWESSGDTGSSGLTFPGGIPTDMTPDVTVCKDGSNGCYKTIQEAVDAAPNNLARGKKFVVKINEGVYEETVRVPREKKNVVFFGDGMGKTVITGSMNVGQVGVTTYTSATVGVLGDGFMASSLTIENTAGRDAHQAVAFRSDSDLSMLENCELLASVFEDCTILVRPRQLNPEKGENNAVTAHGRTDPAMTTGFVFRNCLINGTDAYMALYKANRQVHVNYLGRPWKEYSRTVLISCVLESLITPPGWMPWSGDFALGTLYYGEFNNSGPGSETSGRVEWSSQIPADHVNVYSVENFIQGGEWITTSS